VFVPLLLNQGVVLYGDRVPHVVLRWLRVLHLPLAVVAAPKGAATVQLYIKVVDVLAGTVDVHAVVVIGVSCGVDETGETVVEGYSELHEIISTFCLNMADSWHDPGCRREVAGLEPLHPGLGVPVPPVCHVAWEPWGRPNWWRVGGSCRFVIHRVKLCGCGYLGVDRLKIWSLGRRETLERGKFRLGRLVIHLKKGGVCIALIQLRFYQSKQWH